jgi:hypothetical protein
MSDCLHCDINELVRKHLRQRRRSRRSGGRWPKALPISFVAPEIDQANLMASAIASRTGLFGKTGAIEIGDRTPGISWPGGGTAVASAVRLRSAWRRSYQIRVIF